MGDGSSKVRSLSSGSEQVPLPRALWTVFTGHLLVLIAAVTDSLSPNTAIVAAIACSIIAVAALMTLTSPHGRVRRAVMALTGGHCVAAAIMLAGVAPTVPWSVPLAGLGAAAALGCACLVVVRVASTVNRRSRPLTMAPRVAAIALVVQALLQRGAAPGASMPLRAAIFLSISALGIALLASLSIIILQVRPRWAIAWLLAWTVGWVASTADVGALALWSLGGPAPMGPHQLSQLDAAFVQILATAGGLGIGAALATSIRDIRSRHSAVVLLAGYAAFGVITAVAEHRIELATDFPSITALRNDRDLTGAITAFALAGVLWLYWRSCGGRRAGIPGLS